MSKGQNGYTDSDNPTNNITNNGVVLDDKKIEEGRSFDHKNEALKVIPRGLVKKQISIWEEHKSKDKNKSLKFNPKNKIGGEPKITELPNENSDFSVTYENGIIKFKIKSGPEDYGDNPATSSGGVSKFDYNKKPDKTDLENLKNESNTYLSKTYTKEKEKKEILTLLDEASKHIKAKFPGAKLDDNFFIAVMKVASEKRGISISNEEEFNKCFNKALKGINSELNATKYKTEGGVTLHQIAKFFSAKFQKFSQDNNYITPRTDSNGKLIDIGRRLFRVCTEENIDAFKEMQTKETKGDNGQSPSASPRSASSRDKSTPLGK
jgi:hypothetical protein